jgi:uncharacterized membrane protein
MGGYGQMAPVKPHEVVHDIEQHRPIPLAHPLRFLLLIPFVAVLWVPFYNRLEPSVFGIPFFYWYQLVWVVLASIITVIVYRAEDNKS